MNAGIKILVSIDESIEGLIVAAVVVRYIKLSMFGL